MMFFQFIPSSASLLFLILMTDGGELSVHYTQDSICALKGSTVTMGCRHRFYFNAAEVFWSKEDSTLNEPPDLSLDPEYRDRVQYITDRLRGCSLRLSNVTEQDQRKYYAIIVLTSIQWLQGEGGVNLSVTDLQVEMVTDAVAQGDEVYLKCKTTCRLTRTPTFTWYKNGHVLLYPISTSEQLHLPSVSQEDAGSYSCAVEDKAGGQSYRSPAATLKVYYPPKNISVSISSSGEMLEGSSVTLTCSSDANPPVETYTWYKVNESSPVGYGQSYSFTLISSNTGWFYCKARNKYGTQKAAAVPVASNVSQSPSHSFSVMVLCGAVGVGLCGVGAVIAGLFCVSRRKRQRRNAVKHQDGGAHDEDSTYTSLEPMTRSSKDVYSTLATRPPDNTYEALDPRSISSEYNTLDMSAYVCMSSLKVQQQNFKVVRSLEEA